MGFFSNLFGKNKTETKSNNELLDKANELFDDAIEWNDKGCDFCEQRNLSKGIECFLTAIKIFPPYAEAYQNLANCYDDLGQSEKAIETYGKALKNITDDDRRAMIWKNLAIAWERAGNKEKADGCRAMAKKLE